MESLTAFDQGKNFTVKSTRRCDSCKKDVKIGLGGEKNWDQHLNSKGHRAKAPSTSSQSTLKSFFTCLTSPKPTNALISSHTDALTTESSSAHTSNPPLLSRRHPSASLTAPSLLASALDQTDSDPVSALVPTSQPTSLNASLSEPESLVVPVDVDAITDNESEHGSSSPSSHLTPHTHLLADLWAACSQLPDDIPLATATEAFAEISEILRKEYRT